MYWYITSIKHLTTYIMYSALVLVEAVEEALEVEDLACVYNIIVNYMCIHDILYIYVHIYRERDARIYM